MMVDRGGGVLISLTQPSGATSLSGNGGNPSLGFMRGGETGSQAGEVMVLEPRGHGALPVPMNLFATWEVDRCSPDCVPRLCSLTLKKLLVLRELDRDLNSVVIAVKLQGSKRVLRSNEYIVPPCGVMETDLELTFSLQRDANKLQIMLQRRKRYKNRTILGYKSLALGTINMAEVMQHPTEGMRSLTLHSNRKDHTVRVAEISIFSLSSQPIDHEEVIVPEQPKIKDLDIERYWEEEEDDDSYSSEQDGSDECGPGQDVDDEDDEIRKPKKFASKLMRSTSLSRQPNFKQKFVSLLKKFKVNDDPMDTDRACREQEEEEEELGLLYDSLDECNNSESGFDIEDNESVVSTPKPTLRRYFEGISNSGSQTEIGSINSQKGPDKNIIMNDTESGTVTLITRSDDPEPRPAPHYTRAMNPGGAGESSIRNAFTRLDQQDQRLDQLALALQTDASGSSFLQPVTAASSASLPETSEAISAVSQAGNHSSKEGTERVPYLGMIGRAESQIITSPRQENRLARGPRSTSMKDHQNSRVASDRAANLEPEFSPEARLCSQAPRKSVYDELNEILGSEQQLPESIILLSVTEWQGQYLCEQLKGKLLTVSTCSPADVQAAFSGIITRIQRYCNCNSLMPPPVKVLVAGEQSFLSLILRYFVEQLAGKTPDWLNYLRFLILPLGAHTVARYLASLDSKYSSLFMDTAWRDLFNQAEPPISDRLDVPGRVAQYLAGACVSHQLSISEAMLTYRQRSDDMDDLIEECSTTLNL